MDRVAQMNAALVQLVRSHGLVTDASASGGAATPSFSHAGSIAGERANNPFPRSSTGSEYRDDSTADGYHGSVVDTGAYTHDQDLTPDEDDLLEEDSEEDLSSDPPQQRSEGVSFCHVNGDKQCVADSLDSVMIVARNGNGSKRRSGLWSKTWRDYRSTR